MSLARHTAVRLHGRCGPRAAAALAHLDRDAVLQGFEADVLGLVSNS